MYTTLPEVEMDIYADHWHKDRYRIELTAELPIDPSNIETALDHLDYQEIDSDQWGQSFRQRQEPQKTAELDEWLLSEPAMKLTLSYGGLEETELEQAKYHLQLEFEQIYEILRDDLESGEELSKHDYFPDHKYLQSPFGSAVEGIGY